MTSPLCRSAAPCSLDGLQSCPLPLVKTLNIPRCASQQQIAATGHNSVKLTCLLTATYLFAIHWKRNSCQIEFPFLIFWAKKVFWHLTLSGQPMNLSSSLFHYIFYFIYYHMSCHVLLLWYMSNVFIPGQAPLTLTPMQPKRMKVLQMKYFHADLFFCFSIYINWV